VNGTPFTFSATARRQTVTINKLVFKCEWAAGGAQTATKAAKALRNSRCNNQKARGACGKKKKHAERVSLEALKRRQ
jgi:hypothetical protein